MFEPNRLAAACLEAAYARLVPTPWRRARGGRGLRGVNGSPGERAHAVMPPAREARHG